MKTIAAYTSGSGEPDTLIHKFVVSTGLRASFYNPNLYNRQSHRPADLAVFDTMRANASDACFMHTQGGTPTVVIDLGYVDRASADNPSRYYQVGLIGLGWLPPFACPPDRFERLGVKVSPAKTGGDYALILPQLPKDAAHGMDADQIRSWVKRKTEEIEAYGIKVKVRPHPHSSLTFGDYEISGGTLTDALKGAKFVVTFNSTSGVDALLAGVPVFCNEDAHYACVANHGTYAKPEVASIEERESYFHRLAYCQWLPGEVEDGSAWAFLKSVIDGTVKPYEAPKVSKPAPAAEPVKEPAPAAEPVKEPAPAAEPVKEAAPTPAQKTRGRPPKKTHQ